MSNKCEFVGRVVAVGKTEKLGREDKPFYKRIIVVDDAEVGAKWANEVPFEATGDKCQYLDRYKKGDEVEIEFYPNGRAWEDPKTGKTRYFSSNRIGYIKKLDAMDYDGGEQADGEAEAPAEGVDDIDNMPF